MEDLPDILKRLLRARGIVESDWERFLNPSLRDLVDPAELPGVAEASRTILDAVAARRRIVVFGDYDCDGVCATAILVKALRAVASDPSTVSPFLPERLSEGYGMSDASVARMLAENPGVGLVVSVDNGINSIGQVADLKERGVEVVVTDHHLPTRAATADGSPGDVVLPRAAVVVNPKVDAPAKLRDLCGAGVAFFLARRVIDDARAAGTYSGPKVCGPLLVLAGLATVTDIMPLLGQNRILVAEALRNFQSHAPLGLKKLHLRAARNARGEMTSRDFSFLLGPRINAAGRLASGMDALDLILEERSEDIANGYAISIDHNNAERKAIEQRMTEEALAKVVPGAAAQVIDLPGGHQGVAGIVAARVMERLGGTVPVCVIAGGHGSGRSPGGVNIRDAFVACSEVLSNYGGHAAAGGFSVKEGMVDEFRTMLVRYCERMREGCGDVVAAEATDLWIEPEEVSLVLAESLLRMEPFGEGNPEPVFGLRGVRLRDVKRLGADGRHLSAVVAVEGQPAGLRTVWWNAGDRADGLRTAGDGRWDVRLSLFISDYGDRHVEGRLCSVADHVAQ